MERGIWLVICGRGSEADAFRIDEGCHIIGRSRDCDIRLLHPFVSRQHAAIRNERGKLSIQDLGSLNGTFVDGEPVDLAEIKVGSSLRLGRVTLDVLHNLASSDHPKGEEDATDLAPVHEPADVHRLAECLPPALKGVLLLLLNGGAEKQIARQLGLRGNTVHSYLKEIYKRLGVHSRAELCAYCRDHDTMPEDQPKSAAHFPAVTHARFTSRPQSFLSDW